MATHRLLPGEHFAGQFRVERLLGEGAMAHVYVVDVLAGGPRRALKVLRPEIVDEDPKAQERFALEASAQRLIGSEHVVEVLASGVSDGHRWLLMELLEGLALDGWVATPRTAAERWSVLDQMLGTMALAHRSGVIHRDLKSENIILLDRSGMPFVKLLDFGVAKTVQQSELMHASLTTSGLGTPLWAAPEQGRDGVRLTPACDVWALGLLTFFVLTSKSYWRHMNLEKSSAIDIAVEVLRTPIEPASARAAWLGCTAALPSRFDDWFLHCVNREPTERFQNAGAAHAALRALVGTQ